MIQIVKVGIEKLRQLNLFLDVKALQEQNKEKVRDQILSTRLYLFLFLTSLIVLILFNSVTRKTISITEFEPSLDRYDYLYSLYPNTLSCSCKQLAIQYKKFLSMNYLQHPVCTSDFLSSKWIFSLFNSETSRLTPLDFRLTAAAQFRLLKAMCSLITEGVNFLREISLEGALISSKTVSRQSLNSQMNDVVAKLNTLVQTSLLSTRAPELIMMVIRQSRLNSAVYTNAFHLSKPPYNHYEVINNFYPRYDNASYQNETTNSKFNSCGPLSSATYKGGIYNWSDRFQPYFEMMNPSPSSVFIIPGMNVGCMPYDAIINSNLQCFFSSECLNTMARWISNLPPSDWPKPLNSSKLIKFSMNTTIASIMDEQMIDHWNNTVNFTIYYRLCSPSQCTYTFVGSENFLYVITLIISLVGSLNVAFCIISPLMIKFGRYIKEKVFKKKNQSKISFDKRQEVVENRITTDRCDICVSTIELQRTSQNIEDSSKVKNNCVSQLIEKMKSLIRTLNFFEDDFDEFLPGVYATYIYMVLLGTCIGIVIFYSLLTIQKHSITILKPSLSTFENLYESYSETLNCPCSELAITHKNMFIFSDPVYHQICSSEFLSPVWLDGFFNINYSNESDRRLIPDGDFRKNGKLLFYHIMALCNFSQEAVQRFTDLFLIDVYAQTKALSRIEFELNANLRLAEFREGMKQGRIILVSLLRTLLTASGLEGGIQFQSIEIDGKTFLQRDLPSPSGYNACACSVARNCPDPNWSGAQFLCFYGENCTVGNVIWSIPGFIKACTTFDSILASDLRCLFNQTCLNILLSMSNVDMSKRDPLPSSILNINILNSSTLVSFQPEDTIEKIFSELMIDHWTMATNFVGYYNTCAPLMCTYTITQRLNIFYALTMITTFFGGLVVTFRLFVPISVRFVYLILTRRQNGRSTINNQTSRRKLHDIFEWYYLFKGNLIQLIKTMNLFKKESIFSEMANKKLISIKASRIYMIVLTISIFTIIVFKSVDQRTISETISFPSLDIYDQLQIKYPQRVSCTCQQFTILFKSFASIKPKFHQICSSDFVNQSWITLLNGYNNTINSYQKFDRPLLSKYFQILSWLCDESQKIIDFWTFALNSRVILDTSTFNRSSFQLFVDTSMDTVKNQSKGHFQIIIPFITEMFQSNLLPTVFNTDWIIEYGNQSNGYLLQSIPRLYMNNSCNCIVSNSCQDYLRIASPDLILPGLFNGCSPIEGLRLSTLQCFYSSECISTILNSLEYYRQIDGLLPNYFNRSTIHLPNFHPLDNLTKSRFLPNSSIGQLINEMFIDEWIDQISYEDYFQMCAPNQCRYEYTKRQDILYVTTSLLALHGGLTIGWRLIIWNTLKFYLWIKHKYFTRHTIVQPLSISQ